mmetsp:Transcript_18709/g.33852  ORF Transcript_18709/g.33852 Transcript_18709/m.33852 type:complete len:362 (-) Transcript_18709:59-1144(-)
MPKPSRYESWACILNVFPRSPETACFLSRVGRVLSLASWDFWFLADVRTDFAVALIDHNIAGIVAYHHDALHGSLIGSTNCIIVPRVGIKTFKMTSQYHKSTLEGRPPAHYGGRREYSDPMFFHPHLQSSESTSRGSSHTASLPLCSVHQLPHPSPLPPPPLPLCSIYVPQCWEPHSLRNGPQPSVRSNPHSMPDRYHYMNTFAFAQAVAAMTSNDTDGMVEADSDDYSYSSTEISSNHTQHSNRERSDTEPSLGQSDNPCQVRGILRLIQSLFRQTRFDRQPRNLLEEAMLCPIQQQIMVDPVIDPDGYSYEREAILKWLNKSSRSPMTRRPLAANQLKENRALKAVISVYLNGDYSNNT